MPTDAKLSQDYVYFCPTCGSPALDRSALAGGEAACKACPWKGKTDELHAVPFSHDFSGSDEMVARFVGEVSNLVSSTMGEGIGRLLLKWGFVTPEFIAPELPVYGRAMAAGVAKAILETREGLATGKIPRFQKKPEAQRRGVH